MKSCNKCNIEKHEEEFSFHPRTGLQHTCKSCQREISRAWYNANKTRQQNNVKRNKEFVAQCFRTWKEKQKCAVCFENDRWCLDLHHLFGKDIEPTRIASHGSIQTLITELNKCVVLCSNCHRKHHHGTLNKNLEPYIINISEKDLICP